ncbi:hydrolase [Streptomyces carminius]|uniref:Hydrolase n=2 Tax=Streptomyces carminius TaxID=2665496 RepID=A0A2M8M5M1_9ACTN|nr:hydrolase [Streptomyces carminius]
MSGTSGPDAAAEHRRAAPAVPVRPGSDGEHAVQRRLGTAERADRFYDEQLLDHLNERMREFVAQQEMFFLATADRHGECDNTFRAGPPGFLHVVDERTLVYPEYRGNGVHASLGNIQENPHLGILLVDFLRARIGLHINGRAEIVEDAEIRRVLPGLPADPVPGRRAQVWVRVTVEEAYIHCAKHIPHLQKAPKGTPRDWGTDDQRRKGGDFFGAARAARDRGPVERPPREHAPEPVRPVRVDAAPPAPPTPPAPAIPAPAREPVPEPVPSIDDPAAWRAHAEQLLARARSRRMGQQGERTPFTGWFG